MLRKFFGICLMLAALGGSGGAQSTAPVKWLGTLPPSCVTNRGSALVFKFGASQGLYTCSGGVYTAIGSGAASPLTLTAASAGQTPLSVTGAVSQTADLFRVNSSASNLVRITKDGGLAFDAAVQAALSTAIVQLYPGGYEFGVGAGAILYSVPAGSTHNFRVNSILNLQIDGSATAGQTRMLVFDVDNNALERVTVGAADSCGSGFKCLRIPN